MADRRDRAAGGIDGGRLEQIVAWIQPGEANAAFAGFHPLGFQAQEPVARAEIPLIAKVEGGQGDLKRAGAPANLVSVGDGRIAEVDLRKDRRGWRALRDGIGRFHVGEAAGGADPHAAVEVFHQRGAVAIVPNQALVLGIASPTMAVVDGEAGILAHPQPAAVVHRDGNHILREQFGAADLLRCGNPIAVDPQAQYAGEISRNPHVSCPVSGDLIELDAEALGIDPPPDGSVEEVKPLLRSSPQALGGVEDQIPENQMGIGHGRVHYQARRLVSGGGIGDVEPGGGGEPQAMGAVAEDGVNFRRFPLARGQSLGVDADQAAGRACPSTMPPSGLWARETARTV